MEYGLIGEKLGHSYSKIIQEKLLEDYTYELHPIPKTDLKTFMEAKAFKAINVTIPYKQEVIPYLDEIDEAAKKIGAVNTIVHQNKRLKGYNTDYQGFHYMLKKHQIDVAHKKVMILGNGGASKAIQTLMKDLNCKQLVVVSRSANDSCISYEEAKQNYRDSEIIINTTPLGMYPNPQAQALNLKEFKNVMACLDVVYNPLHTQFIRQAKDLKIKAVGGLEMLVAQAKYALEYFKEISIEEKRIDDIYREILLDTTNLVFIGMPSCGKTTIAKKCAKIMGRKCIDIDKEIIKKTKMSISEYFQTHGEAKFREVEKELCLHYAKQNNLVISCGGGIVLKKENISALKMNGLLIQLKRNIDHTQVDESRPLSSSIDALKKMEKKRAPLYAKARDGIVINNKSASKISKQVISIYENLIKQY